MSNLLNGLVAVVTGGASGIGRGMVEALVKEEVSVVIADIRAELAYELSTELNSKGHKTMAYPCDVSKLSDLYRLAEATVAHFGRVDILCNNAGVTNAFKPILDMEEADVNWVLGVNLMGVWNGCKVFGNIFKKQNSKSYILNTGSEHSLYPAHPLVGMYTASKHAVLGMTAILKEEVPEQMQVSLFCPGLVQTELVTSGQLRPDIYGGPVGPSNVSYQDTDPGMSYSEAGQIAIDGIKRGDFYIFTHPHNIDYIEEKHQEIKSTFLRHQPRYDNDNRDDMRMIMKERGVI